MTAVPRKARLDLLATVRTALCAAPLALGASSALSEEAGTADQIRLLGDSVTLLRSLDRNAGYLPEVAAGLNRLQRQLERLLHSPWEYRLLQPNRFENSVEQLNVLGKEGWELVGVSPEAGFIFKRRVRR